MASILGPKSPPYDLFWGFLDILKDNHEKRLCGVYDSRAKPRIGCNYNLQMNSFKLDAGVYKYDFPISLGRSGLGEFAINHNVFLATEVNVLGGFFVGPKLGYEFNFIILQGRLSIIDYLDFKRNNSLVARPELGLTLIGRVSLTYGFNINIYDSRDRLTIPHVISFTYLFW